MKGMSIAIERNALYQAIDKLPEHRLIELARFIEFLQFKSQQDDLVHTASHEDTDTQGQPPFNPVYFPEGILQGYDFSPEFIADARKELWAGFGEGPVSSKQFGD
jgi:hypothetical protein